jgi:intracellular sulfur oxidation DsrE/DsrF family protein
MKKNILAACAMVFVLALGAVSQTPAGPKHHVVFELSEPEGAAWGSLIIHVNNKREAFAKDGGSEVEVVFFAAGLSMLRKTNIASQMNSGVAEFAREQEAGWAYIH